MKLSPLLEQLLRKHKLVGNPVKEVTPEEETKEKIYQKLKENRFFRDIEECELNGISLCYDELVEYAIEDTSNEKSTAEEEVEYIKESLQGVFREVLDSFYLAEKDGKYYLHIKYTEEPSPLILGPHATAKKSSNTSEEISKFKALWNDKVEYRKFDNGDIRVCASLNAQIQDTVRYEMLSKIFDIKTVPEQSNKNKRSKRKGRILTPTIALDTVTHKYNGINKKKSHESINKSLEAMRSSFPVSILESIYTGSYSRQTRAIPDQRAQIYLKIGRGHLWPEDNGELSDASITALNGILGKFLEKHSKIEGITEENTLYTSLFGENFEFIFDVQKEMRWHKEKYYLMNFRIEYERFFQEISIKQKIFPKLCALVKTLLYSHGIYPHYIGDEAVEILCYRTGYKANTLAGGLRSVISTQYSHGYTLDIRRGKNKIRSKNIGKIEITHQDGIYTIDLPEEKIFSKINNIFRRSLLVLENIPGITSNNEISSAFKEIFIPNIQDISFSLSRVQMKGYEEISHYSGKLGGSLGKIMNESHCKNVLLNMGSIPYFCRSGVIHVSVNNRDQLSLIVGASVLLTGMKYINMRGHQI
ncbi:hypothetical protein NEIG_00506 [Nematocida sp. ERTm5]|nr:hypothetical protein NEIG_00506 [Nematocida sp. ERTm5]